MLLASLAVSLNFFTALKELRVSRVEEADCQAPQGGKEGRQGQEGFRYQPLLASSLSIPSFSRVETKEWEVSQDEMSIVWVTSCSSL